MGLRHGRRHRRVLGHALRSFAGSITPDPFNLILSILFLAAVVLGGSGNLAGAIVGAVVIGYLPERFRGFSQYRVLVFGAALVIMMIFRPQGSCPTSGAPPSSRTARRPPSMADAMLRLTDLTMRFGGLTALDRVSFDDPVGRDLRSDRPNGAGKTTCFNAITGVYQPTAGTIEFDGHTLGGQKRHEITKLGIARTFQNIRLFPEMTALENVLVGADAHHVTSVPGALFTRRFRHRREEQDGSERARQLLRFMGIADRAEDAARNLPYGVSAPAGDRPGAGHRAEAALPRRAGRRLQPGREAAADGAHPRASATRVTPCCSSSTTWAWS